MELESGFQSQTGIGIGIRLSESAWNRNQNQDIAGIVHHCLVVVCQMMIIVTMGSITSRLHSAKKEAY